MLGLGNYSSSDEEADDPNGRPIPKSTARHSQSPKASPTLPKRIHSIGTTNAAPQPEGDYEPPLSGPAQGPSLPETALDDDYLPDDESLNATGLVHSLTMPPIPNLDIPPSPPGTPSESSSAKFAHFLSLKKKNIHFNTKLVSSPALANPAFLDRLLDMAGVSQADTYAVAESNELALPEKWPEWANAEELNKTQKRLAKKKERVVGERVAFVKSGK